MSESYEAMKNDSLVNVLEKICSSRVKACIIVKLYGADRSEIPKSGCHQNVYIYRRDAFDYVISEIGGVSDEGVGFQIGDYVARKFKAYPYLTIDIYYGFQTRGNASMPIVEFEVDKDLTVMTVPTLKY